MPVAWAPPPVSLSTGSFGAQPFRGDRATALIEDIRCENAWLQLQVRNTSALVGGPGLMLGINQRHILEILGWELVYVDR